MASPDKKEDSSQRIQQLREKIELYNSTIAEAMQAVAGGSASTGATASAAASTAGAVGASCGKSTICSAPRSGGGPCAVNETTTQRRAGAKSSYFLPKPATGGTPANTGTATAAAVAAALSAARSKERLDTVPRTSPPPPPPPPQAQAPAQPDPTAITNTASANATQAAAATRETLSTATGATATTAAARGSHATDPSVSPAPRLARNLAREFSDNSSPLRGFANGSTAAAAGTTATATAIAAAAAGVNRAAAVASPAQYTDPARAAPSPPTAAPQHASPPPPPPPRTGAAHQGRSDSADGGYEIVEEIIEEEVTTSDDEEDDEEEDTTSDSHPHGEDEETTSPTHTSTSDGELGFDFDSEDEAYRAFLEQLVGDADLRRSLESALAGRFRAAMGENTGKAAASGGGRHGHTQRASHAERSGSPHGNHRHGGGAGGHGGDPHRFLDTSTEDMTTTITATTTAATSTCESSEDGHGLRFGTDNGGAATKNTNRSSGPAIPIVANPAADARVSFDGLETSYYRLRAVLTSSLKVAKPLSLSEFPQPLPLQERCAALERQRDGLIAKEQALRANPPAGHVLSEIRATYAEPLAQQAREMINGCEALAACFTRVQQRQQSVTQKRGQLVALRDALRDRRAAKRQILEDIRNTQGEVDAKRSRLREGEQKYAAHLSEHSAREKAIQDSIGEVEALGRNVSSWLHILEERDANLTAKEEKLRRVQTDLMRRSDDVQVFRRLTAAKQRAQVQPPPPPPPHTMRE